MRYEPIDESRSDSDIDSGTHPSQSNEAKADAKSLKENDAARGSFRVYSRPKNSELMGIRWICVKQSHTYQVHTYIMNNCVARS